MVATSDFSGFVSSVWALARAPEILPIVSLERCMAGALRAQHIKAHRSRFGASSFNPVPRRLFGVLRHEAFELRLGILMLEVGLSGAPVHAGEFGPGVGRTHVDDPHRLDTGSWWFNAE